MLTLRDFLAAKSTIAKKLMDKAQALVLLRDLDQRASGLTWLKTLLDANKLTLEQAKLIHGEVEKFEFLRAEAFYIEACQDFGLDQTELDRAREASKESGYQTRSGVFLLQNQVLDQERNRVILSRAREKFNGDTQARLETFRNTVLAGTDSAIQVPNTAALHQSQPSPAPESGPTDLTSTLSMPSNLSGELLPAQIGAQFDPNAETLSPTPPGAMPPGAFSFSAEQLRSGEFVMPGVTPLSMTSTPPPVADPDATINQLPPNMMAQIRAESAGAADPDATINQLPQNMVADLRIQSTKKSPGSDLIGDPMIAAAIASRYEVEKVLGQGQMGKVFLATSKELGQKVALKLTQPKGRKAEEITARFKREILVTTLVSHPNVVEVYDKDELPDGSFLMAMEVLEGKELKDYLKEKGTLSIEEALDIMTQLTQALQACHEAEVVHRDVKPENVTVVERDGQLVVKLVDFGLARLLTQEEVVQEHVFTSLATQVSGSPHYMAPESITDADKVDFRCDLYALGVTLFELITGKRPFNGKNHTEILDHHLNSSVPLLEDVMPDLDFPRSLETTIRKLMEKDRELRLQSCAEALKAYEDIRNDLKEGAKPKRPTKRKSILRSFTDLFKRGKDEE